MRHVAVCPVVTQIAVLPHCRVALGGLQQTAGCQESPWQLLQICHTDNALRRSIYCLYGAIEIPESASFSMMKAKGTASFATNSHVFCGLGAGNFTQRKPLRRCMHNCPMRERVTRMSFDRTAKSFHPHSSQLATASSTPNPCYCQSCSILRSKDTRWTRGMRLRRYIFCGNGRKDDTTIIKNSRASWWFQGKKRFMLGKSRRG